MFRIATVVLVVSLTLSAGVAHAQSVINASRAMSNASALSAQGASVMVRGSVDVIAAASDLTVASVTTAAGVSTLVLRDLSKAGEISLQVASEAAAAATIAVGSVVSVVEATGYTLVHAGRVIAFIPNEAGKAMLHQTRQSSVAR